MKNRLLTTTKRFFILPVCSATLLALLLAPSVASAQKVAGGAPIAPPGARAQPPYAGSVFAQSLPGVYTQPDSITFNSTAIFIGYCIIFFLMIGRPPSSTLFPYASLFR